MSEWAQQDERQRREEGEEFEGLQDEDPREGNAIARRNKNPCVRKATALVTHGPRLVLRDLNTRHRINHWEISPHDDVYNLLAITQLLLTAYYRTFSGGLRPRPVG